MRSDEMTSSSILVCLSIFVILVEDSHILFSLLFCAVCRIFLNIYSMQAVVKINTYYLCNLQGSNFVQKQFDKARHRVL